MRPTKVRNGTGEPRAADTELVLIRRLEGHRSVPFPVGGRAVSGTARTGQEASACVGPWLLPGGVSVAQDSGLLAPRPFLSSAPWRARGCLLFIRRVPGAVFFCPVHSRRHYLRFLFILGVSLEPGLFMFVS